LYSKFSLVADALIYIWICSW